MKQALGHDGKQDHRDTVTFASKNDGKHHRDTVTFVAQVDAGDRTSGRRPLSLRRTAEGGSTRLTGLSELIRSFSLADSTFPSRQGSMSRASGESALDELNRLQYMLGSELPNISRLSSPSYVSDLFVPRKTHDDLAAFLESPQSLESVWELPEGWRPSEQTRAHDFLRDMAMKKLESDTFNKLSVVFNIHVAEMKQNEDNNAPKNTPFAWTLEDFLRRRRELNISWLNTLSQRSDKEFTMLKFKCDVEELSKLLQLIFKGLKPSVNLMARQDLFAFVHDAHDFLKFPQNLRIDAKRNMVKLREQVNTYLDMWYYKRGEEEESYKHDLQLRLMNLAVTGPIELRYQVNWLDAKTDQAVMKLTNTIKEMEEKVENLRAEEAKESLCARLTLDMYYHDVENFKGKISELSAKFENEFEKIDNEITYKRVSMDKMRAQRKYLEEQMARFKEEIEQLREKELEEKEAEEQRKRIQEQKALEEELAKKAKKKAQKKGKKK